MYSHPRVTIKKLAEEIGLSVCTFNKALRQAKLRWWQPAVSDNVFQGRLATGILYDYLGLVRMLKSSEILITPELILRSTADYGARITVIIYDGKLQKREF